MANEMLKNPLDKTSKALRKAPRAEHPGEPTAVVPPATADVSSGQGSANRLGPNRVRKSFYLPTDTAEELAAGASRLHHQSAGRISKAEAAGAIIRFGLEHMADVRDFLQMPHE